MKEQLLIYKGFLNNRFCFLDNQKKMVCFTKSRSDLINEFSLKEDKFKNHPFLARYFVHHSGNIEVFILSDLVLSN